MHGTYFDRNRLVSRVGCSPRVDQARKTSCLHSDLSKILELARPPDPDLVDLIEQALLLGQIDGQRADFAYLWLGLNSQVFAV